MSGFGYLAWCYIRHYRWRTLLLLVCLTLSSFLPLSVQMLVTRFEATLWARSESTPMVLGAKGSRFDLVLHALYYRGETPEMISMADWQQASGTGLVDAIPLYSDFQARGFPIVGTVPEYFAYRTLRVSEGRGLIFLGECVIGASVAEEIGLQVGDSLMSDPENVFNIAGDYPLKMRVVGILEATETVDDSVVFVDTKTAWIIAGIGHGHQEVNAESDDSVVLRREGSNVVANAALLPFMEVTESNRDSFHFHANPEDRPLSALLIVPHDVKSGTLFRGRYQDPSSRVQVLRPREVVNELMATVMQVKRFLDVNFVLVAVVAGLFLSLVVLLSLRLRDQEMETLYLLGCRRGTVWTLVGTELLLVLLASGLLTLSLSVVTRSYFETWLTQILS